MTALGVEEEIKAFVVFGLPAFVVPCYRVKQLLGIIETNTVYFFRGKS